MTILQSDMALSLVAKHRMQQYQREAEMDHLTGGEWRRSESDKKFTWRIEQLHPAGARTVAVLVSGAVFLALALLILFVNGAFTAA